jgi:glucose/arabinose dehydrogenase
VFRTRRLLASATSIVLIATAVIAVPGAAKQPSVKLAPILSGYERPLLVTHDGHNVRTIFVVEQGGRIKRATHKNGSWKKLGGFLNISSKVNDPTESRARSEQGLLGLAFHPNYKKNGRFYVSYTRRAEGKPSGPDGDVVIAEYRRKSIGKARPGSERILIVLEKSHSNHNGGHLAFGPDGKLYIGLGDGGGQEDPNGNGQDLSTLWGSILRIDPLDPDGIGPMAYKVPHSNPYTSKPGRAEIWLNGTRNPWRYSFDRKNGNLWVADVGEGAREEVNKATVNRFGKGAGRGLNYGWSDCEGSIEFNGGGSPCTQHDLPIHDYASDRDNGWCSVTGGYVNRGPGPKAWKGLYVGGDFCGGLFVLNQAGKRLYSRNTGINLSSFGEDRAGRLFATGIFNGKIYRVKMSGPRPSAVS